MAVSPYAIIAGFIIISVIVSAAAKFAGLKGIQIWLPLSIITAVGFDPIIGFFIVGITLSISHAIKPVPPISLFVMLLLDLALVFSLSFFTITAANFVTIAMALTTMYLIVVNIVLSIIWPDLKTVVIFLVFGLVTSWIIFTFWGWDLVQLL